MMSDQDDADRLALRLSAMEAELAFLRDENARLRHVLGLDAARPARADAWRPTLFGSVRNASDWLEYVDHESPAEAKVTLFRELFAGRSDVYAIRWEKRDHGQGGLESRGARRLEQGARS